MRKFKGWKGKVLLALLSTFFTSMLVLVAGEIYIRLTKPYETPDSKREVSLEYEATLFSRNAFPQRAQQMHGRRLDPSQPDYIANRSANINGRGYRGRDFVVPKPEGIIRIVFLGGSQTFDIWVQEGCDWPHLVGAKLCTMGYEEVEVINASTPGHATWDSLGRLYAEIWMFEPDYIVVCHAWNDIKYFSWLRPDRSLLRGYRPATTSGSGKRLLVGNPFMYYTGWLDRLFCHSQLYVHLRWRYWSWRLGMIGLEGLIKIGENNLPQESSYSDKYSEWGLRQYELNLRMIADTARNIGAIPVFLTQPRLATSRINEKEREKIRYDYVHLSHKALVRAFEDCDEAVFRAAEAEDVPVLDLSKMLSGNSMFFTDHVHNTPEGSEAIADAVADFLAVLIGEDKLLKLEKKSLDTHD